MGGLCYATNCLNKFGDKVCLLGMEVLRTLGFQGLAAGYIIGGVGKYNAMKCNPLITDGTTYNTLRANIFFIIISAAIFSIQ